MAMTWVSAADLDLDGTHRIVITGPAGVGKSTLARSIAQRYNQTGTPAPIVIDYDRLAVALGSPHHHHHPDHHRAVAKAAWVGAIGAINRVSNAVPVVLIHAEPGPTRMAYYAATSWHIVALTRDAV